MSLWAFEPRPAPPLPLRVGVGKSLLHVGVATKRGFPAYSSPFRAVGSPWEEQGFSASRTHPPGSCAEGLLLAERSGAPFPTHHS